MSKAKIGTLVFTSLLLGGCFTPAAFKDAPEEGTEAGGDEAPIDAVTIAKRGARGGAVAAEAGGAGESAAPMAAGAITYDAPFDGAPTSSEELETGLLVEEFEVGRGNEVAAGGVVTVHYTGYLADGTVFDSSTKRGVPASFVIGKGKVIPGWDKGLMGMKVGGKRRLHVSAALGYGARQAGKIPANADLVFVIELVAASGAPRGEEAFAGKGLSTKKKSNGLVITTYVRGKGAAADIGDEVHIHYTGTLDDGTVFDSSLKRGVPMKMPLGKAVAGWNEGVKGMKAGGLRKLVIPPALGYGDQAKGPIPANSTLTFTLEMMAVNKRPKGQSIGRPAGR